MQPQILAVRESGLIASGAEGLFQLDLDAACALLYRLVVVALGAGAGVPFTVELFEASPAAQSESASDSVAPDTGDLHPALYQPLNGPIASTGGIARWDAYAQTGGPAVVFPAQPDDAAAERVRVVWLRVRPATPGTYEYCAALAGVKGMRQ